MTKQMLSARNASAFLGFAVSFCIVVWLYYTVNWGEVGPELARVNHLIFVPITVCTMAQVLLRAMRWRYLLPHGEGLSLRVLFDGIMLSNYGNFLLPLRAGEFLRPLLVCRESEISFSSAFASVVIERFLDLSAVLLLFSALPLEKLDPLVKQGAGLLGILAGLLLLFILLSATVPEILMKIMSFMLLRTPAGVRPKLEKFVADLLNGANVLRGKNLFAALALTALVWLLTIMQYQALAFFLGYPNEFGFGMAITVMVALAVAAPSAPGFIGVFQGGCVAAFALYGLPREQATTYAITAHVYQYLLVIIYGFYLVLHYGVSLKNLAQQSQVQ